MSRNPKEAEGEWLENQRGGKAPLSYPTDLPPIYFNIFETESQLPDITTAAGRAAILRDVAAGGVPKRKLDHKQTYKLPLPSPIADQTGVSFDTNFSWGSVAARAFNAGGGLDQTAIDIARGVGYTPNHHKTVVLEQPEFKTHSFEWKLAPRTKDESRTIQQILHSLRKGMTPKTTQIGNFNALLEFPRIFLMSFSPSPQYLFKFKPCVLRNMTVDYNGGNPVPVFYGADITNTAKPESVRVRLEFLEIEYWIRQDLERGDVDGLPSHDPHLFKDYDFTPPSESPTPRAS